MKAVNADLEARNALLELQNALMKRALYGQRAERSVQLVDQLALSFEEREAGATEDELAAQTAARGTNVEGFVRRRPARKPLPEHLPRERIVIAAPPSCPCCGSDRLSKLGEDVTEALEVIPRAWKVVQTVRERFACRACEAISQPPAPLHQLIEAHVLAAERLHGDDTHVKVLAKVKTDTARLWTYVRDDRPFGGRDPPAALFRYSRDRRGEHPQAHLVSWSGILQADAYSGYNGLFRRGHAPLTRALCWAHARRKFFELADPATQLKQRKGPAIISPIAAEAVQRIDAIFDVERTITGTTAKQRVAVRSESVRPLVDALELWLRQQRACFARSNPVAERIDYMLKDWAAFARFIDDGRICLTNNAAERALRGIALGRKAWLFAGSDRGGQRAAFMYTLIVTAKLNDVDPQAWLADVLARIADQPQTRLHELLPWNWRSPELALRAA